MLDKLTMKPFNISSRNDTINLLTILDFSCPNLNILLRSNAEFTIIRDTDLNILLLHSIICLGLCMGAMYSAVKFDSRQVDHFTRSNLGYVSAMFLTTLYFQYFGFFVMLVLMTINESRAVWVYLLFALTLVIYTTVCYKNAFVIFLNRFSNHPRIQESGIGSPRGKFLLISLMTIMGSYIVTVLCMRYFWFSLYFVALSAFPLIQVIESALKGSKQCFTIYIQVFSWWPSLYFGIIIRGTDNTLVKMKPFPHFTLILTGILLFGTVINYLQSRLGTSFFIPKRWLPGVHRFITPMSKVSSDIQEEECCICYHTLKLNPIEPDIEEKENMDNSINLNDLS